VTTQGEFEEGYKMKTRKISIVPDSKEKQTVITIDWYWCTTNALDAARQMTQISGVKWTSLGCFMDTCAFQTKERFKPFEWDQPWNEPK